MDTVTENTKFQSSANQGAKGLGCRFCGTALSSLVVDLGMSPLCQSQVEKDELNQGEVFYPLRAYVCQSCWLVQVHHYVLGTEIFKQYAYFSSFSDSWLEHCKRFVQSSIDRWSLNKDSFVVEVAANDGYLLQYFVEAGIPCLGVEPAENVAESGREKGVPMECEFFGTEYGQSLATKKKADLIIANNVLAHVPDLNDFVGGFKQLLADNGKVSVEFPHLKNLLKFNQFDTIYQEHYCYFSLRTVATVFAKHGLKVFDVETLPTHGGSLRVWATHQENELNVSQSVEQVLKDEQDYGLFENQTYCEFGRRTEETKRSLLRMLMNLKDQGKTVCGYGAPGKGNTLLNYCGIREDLVKFTVDRNPYKQGSFLVGSRIPVLKPSAIEKQKPDYVLILPWNIKEEIMEQMKHIRQWGGKFIIPIPTATIVA